ncbi:UNVERIFIED_CONTAM: hypothetical protein Sradi_6250600 [Sesamum radiatum]|uniref:Uncharacterized protein n=1 Tax=Sesamum radiatum TaxID=300843 RepID=A0AAW2KAN4_SESRA
MPSTTTTHLVSDAATLEATTAMMVADVSSFIYRFSSIPDHRHVAVVSLRRSYDTSRCSITSVPPNLCSEGAGTVISDFAFRFYLGFAGSCRQHAAKYDPPPFSPCQSATVSVLSPRLGFIQIYSLQ